MTTNENSSPSSFLKWAGGKRWLVSKHFDLFPEKKQYSRYIEPFLGGGSVFFHLQPNHAILADKCRDLIVSYQQIRDSPLQITNELAELQRLHSLDFYYQVRAGEHSTKFRLASRFIYLNRTCFNGLYRVNKEGLFNVPIGTKSNISRPDDNFSANAKFLRQAYVRQAGFEKTLLEAGSGDFVFIDPPYVTQHNHNGFLKYNENIFSWKDQEHLAQEIRNAELRGALVMMTNADHVSIRNLYKDHKGKFLILERASIVGSLNQYRGKTTEFIYRSWIK